jgi:3-isopropylmalate/(R)-2-methylmalate dehydratase small subunit
VTTPSGERFGFDIEAFSKHCLMNGLDEIGLTLQHADDIRAFEAGHKASQPWLFL